ncbi:MAG: hypothetical protein A2010_01835 [Nitrospirae bacterium GWD2_57_9]|nr:MAG: hypothetical protein A2010_01835 [Nitrospirae bacterium GWD2_57_9]OGW46161.1 MAG: hypothetical protein A2078_09730 [Nitrospirae bacterium GWC2_57_9]
MKRPALLLLCFLVFTATSAHADFYRWIDRDGKEFFTNDRKQIPPEYQDRATVVKPDENRVTVSGRPDRTARASAPASEHKDRHGRGEDYWRIKAANQRLKLRNQQDEYDLVLKQIEQENSRSKRTKGSKKTSTLEKKKLKLEKEMTQTRRMLEVDLPEEARKADAYPGWLRE